jgi:hypothetical protein
LKTEANSTPTAPATEDDHRLRHVIEVEQLVARHHPRRDRTSTPGSKRGADPVAMITFFVAISCLLPGRIAYTVTRPLPLEPAVPLEDRDLVLLHEELDPLRQA